MPDRIRQEIEELLTKLEEFPPRRPLWQRLTEPAARAWRRAGRALRSLRLPAVSAGHVLLLAITLIVVGYVAVDNTDVARWLIAAGIALFIAAFIFSLRRQSRPPDKLWRGEPLDLRPRSRSRSWWERWRNRR